VSVRKTINEHPAASASVGIGLCLLVGLLLVWQSFGGRSTALTIYAGKAFFSDDDGQTWFLDDVSKLPPYDHNGKQAYRALLFRCGTDKPFIASIAKYSDAELKDFAAHLAVMAQREPGRPPITEAPPPEIALELKKPGDTKWLDPHSAAAYQRLSAPLCPDGSAATTVQPADADAH
jgi:hypothetical protein